MKIFPVFQHIHTPSLPSNPACLRAAAHALQSLFWAKRAQTGRRCIQMGLWALGPSRAIQLGLAAPTFCGLSLVWKNKSILQSRSSGGHSNSGEVWWWDAAVAVGVSMVVVNW